MAWVGLGLNFSLSRGLGWVQFLCHKLEQEMRG